MTTMKLRLVARPALKARVSPHLAGSVAEGTGIDVVAAGGVYTVALDFGSLSEAADLSGFDSSQVFFGMLDGDTESYRKVALDTLSDAISADLGFTGFAAPTALVTLSTSAGIATTAMRSDAAPALSEAIVPAWTGQHTFKGGTIGASPTGQIVLAGQAATPPQWPFDGVLHFSGISPSNQNSFGTLWAFGDNGFHNSTAHFNCMSSRGTIAAPSTIGTVTYGQYGGITGDYTAWFGGGGYDGTSWAAQTGGIAFRPSQQWTNTAHGTFAAIAYTPNNSITPRFGFTFDVDNAFKINKNAQYPAQGYVSGTLLQITGEDAANTFALMDAFGTGKVGFNAIRAARGTGAAFTALQSGDYIGGFKFVGAYANNTFPDVSTNSGGADIVAKVTENQSATNRGTNLEFYTTANGAAVYNLRMTLGVGASLGSGAVDPGVDGVFNVTTGFRIANAAASGALLAGNGTNFVSTATGTGVLTALGVNIGSAGAPVLFNGALGAPSSGTLTSCTGLPISTGVSGFGTGVATALAVNVGTAGAFVVNGGALGSPSSAGTIPAFTLGGTVSGGGNQINNVIIGTSNPLAGSFTTLAASGLISANGGQIAFPATQNASADANTLDDYEEGTWTPALGFATTGDLNVVHSTQVGTYTKIGRLVIASYTIVTSTFTHTTASGGLRITGLPFTVFATQSAVATTNWEGITKASYTAVAGVFVAATTRVDFYASGSAQAISQVVATDVPTGTQKIFSGTGSYFV